MFQVYVSVYPALDLNPFSSKMTLFVTGSDSLSLEI